ncbi:MAG: zinc metalloprotease HtpX [Nitrospinaceae bacterium]|nr:zinc metalloprotease HtpX [Nitrospinaceae bacterium]|tara:strand:+ start:166 stop:1071 length:906 start_codon:yes stop_codon:yes gene_type:complete
MSTLKTTILLGGLTLILVFGGLALGGQEGMILAFMLAVAMNFGAYFYSDKMVLSMYKAEEVNECDSPEIFHVVRKLAQRAEIPMPKIYRIPSDQPNAFATGRNPEHAAVAVTDGITNLLNREELAGVLAHELGHVKNRDILIGTIAATIAGAISMLANMAQWSMLFGGGRGSDRGGHPALMIIMMIVAPIAAMLVQMAVSRTREYKADQTAAELIGTPAPLASALSKLDQSSKRIPMEAEPATAHMFIVSPLAGKDFASLFSTHPPIEKRISALMSLSVEPVDKISYEKREQIPTRSTYEW